MKDCNYLFSLLSLIIICTSFVNIAFADEADSLKLLIRETEDEKRKVDLYHALADIYVFADFDVARKYLDTAYYFAQKIDYRFGEGWNFYTRGRNLAINGYYKEALDTLMVGMSMFEEMTDRGKDVARCCVSLGWTNTMLSRYHAALVYYDKGCKLYDNMEDDDVKSNLLLNIGAVYRELGDVETAIKYNNKAIQLSESLNETSNLAYSYNVLGYIYETEGDFNKALPYYDKALKVTEGDPRLIYIKAVILHNKGNSYMELGDMGKALEFSQAARKIMMDRKDDLSLAYINMTIARIRFERSKNIKYLSILKKAYEVGLSSDDMKLQQHSTANLSEMYAALGMYKKALEQHKLTTVLKDSVLSKDIQLKAAFLESKREFELEQKREEIAQQELVFQNSLAYESKIRRMLLGGVGILLLLALVLYKAYKTTLSIEKQLLIKNKDLKEAEDILEQKNRDLKKYIELNLELEQFAGVASHDLKAPLKTIGGFIGILKRRFYNISEKNYKSYFDMIERSAKSLNLLVDDLLQFSKASSKDLNIEQVSLESMVEEVKENLDFSILKSKGQIEITNCNIELYADRIKIKQILQNLISNALKFKETGRNPFIEVRSWENASHIFVSVKDNGIGISKEHFDKVFEQFARIKTEKQFEGTGLGLSICAKYVKGHKGEIWVKRNVGHGVKFTFSISKSLYEMREMKSTMVVAQKAFA